MSHDYRYWSAPFEARWKMDQMSHDADRAAASNRSWRARAEAAERRAGELEQALRELHSESVKYETQPRFPEDRKRLHMAHLRARRALHPAHETTSEEPK
jgi:hypothetical protein